MVTTGGPDPHPRKSGHDGGGPDLDAMIGDLQGEAARRHAEPAFPLDEEARLGVELDGQAPQPLAPKLERLARAAIRAIRAGTEQGAPQADSQPVPRAAAPTGLVGRVARHAAPPTGLIGRVAGQAVAAQVGPLTRELSALADILASGFAPRPTSWPT